MTGLKNPNGELSMFQAVRLRVPLLITVASLALAACGQRGGNSAPEQSAATPPVTNTASAVNSADTNLDVAKSTIVAKFKQTGVPVDSYFKTFTGRIVYDPANVAAASAAIDVITGSLDIGDEAYNAEVRKKQWFDTATYPSANFKSTAIKATGAGKFDATGTLTVKGKAQTVTVPITVQKTADGDTFDGALDISRKAFGLGDPAWEDVLEDKVNVRFHLVSTGS
jgi:polyisoprenoid-binding protein YceI